MKIMRWRGIMMDSLCGCKIISPEMDYDYSVIFGNKVNIYPVTQPIINIIWEFSYE